MKKFKKIFGLPGNKTQWENPRKSIGERSRVVRVGTLTCWEAVGPARKAWSKLGPEIKDYVENACKYGPGLSVDIYMIGRTEDTAAPKILICSMDFNARKEVRKAIEASGIMKNYPAIGLGDASEPPDLLAQDDIEWCFPPNPSTGNETMVLTVSLDKPFGRRLFIPTQDGGSLRPATAGPILHINGKAYQLTVGHAFLELGEFALSQTRSSNLHDYDFDGQSDTEDDDSSANLELTDKRNSILNDTETSKEVGVRLQGSSSPSPESSLVAARQASLDSGVDLSPENVPAGSNQPQSKKPVVPLKLNPLGKLALLSDTSRNQSLDYALVELGGEYREGSNEVPYGPNGSQRFLQVRQPAGNGPRDVNVITMTASSGFLTGRLCATASYVRFPNQRTLQELYSVRLEGKLADGDCGSGVVDQGTGHMYGHIVAGTAGTGRAYIVSVEQVFRDIQEKMGGRVTLVSPEMISEQMAKEKLSTLLKPDGTKRGEPSRVVEFASEKYFSQLKQPAQSDKDENRPSKSTSAASKPALTPVLLNRPQLIGMPLERTIQSIGDPSQQQNSPKRSKLPRLVTGSRHKVSTLESSISTSGMETKGKGEEKSDICKRNKARNLLFEQQVFALPSDLQVQIIAYLSVPDILSIRMASKTWHKLISVNETPISRAFLEHNPVPSFAISLYPPPIFPAINLHYIYGIWRRLSVASKMSTLMTDWITREIFLRKGDVQRVEFLPRQALLRRRLIPLLFTIFHFFETYRYLHLKHLVENDHKLLPDGCTINPVECQIMNMYDNMTLLQVHQVFPFLVSYLDRRLRPPSYFGRLERSFRGYARDPPPEYVHVGILCIGGLREVVRFSEIENYHTRRKAVDDWYSSVSQEPINPGPQSRRWPIVLDRRQLKQAPSGAAEGSLANTTLVSDSVLSLSASGDGHDDPESTSSGNSQNFNTNFRQGQPMAPLSAEHARLLLSDLPDVKQIWAPTAEALLLARQAVGRRQDIKKNGELIHELILEGFADADKLFYGQAADNINLSIGWGDVFDVHGG